MARFDFDPEKARVNERKHGVSFEEAATAFMDPGALETFDARHSVDEDRYVLLGLSGEGRILVVVFTQRHRRKGQVLRLISARRASRTEIAQYLKRG